MSCFTLNIQNSFVWTEFGWQQVAQITEKCEKCAHKVIIMLIVRKTIKHEIKLVLLLQNMRKEIRLRIVGSGKTTDGIYLPPHLLTH